MPPLAYDARTRCSLVSPSLLPQVCVCVCLQDACVRQANCCVHAAKLVALQLHLLDRDSDLRVVNLRPAELPAAVMSLPRCYQVSAGGSRRVWDSS